MKVILDRIEEAFGVVELPDGSFANLPLSLIPDAKEADVITITIDREETKKRAQRIQNLMEQVFTDRR